MEKRKPGPVASNKSQIVARLPLACRDESAAVEFLEDQRWGDEPSCPRCGTVGECYRMTDSKTGGRSRRYLWRCRSCRKQYTVKVGTIMEDSAIPCRVWCLAFWLACSSKKGVSALQIKRLTGLSYKSALFMMHRIRAAMASGVAAPLSGTVEVDETYVGGKPRTRNYKNVGRYRDRKECVMALVERGGDLRPVHAEKGTGVKRIVLAHVSPEARLITDESPIYKSVGPHFAGGHETVNHTIREFARGDVTTNRAEGFFSILKRGIYGTFHSVSKKHLHRYLSEFEFRYNTRGVDDGLRTSMAIKRAEGRRLTYKQQVKGQ